MAFLDVNVAMYAAGRDHPYRKACAWVMTEITEGRLEAAISVEIIQEVLHRYGQLRQERIAVPMATHLLQVVPSVYSVTEADLRLTIGLFQRYAGRGLAARDLVHVAVMKNNGLDDIISTDKRFDLVERITRLDPLTLYASRR